MAGMLFWGVKKHISSARLTSLPPTVLLNIWTSNRGAFFSLASWWQGSVHFVESTWSKHSINLPVRLTVFLLNSLCLNMTPIVGEITFVGFSYKYLNVTRSKHLVSYNDETKKMKKRLLADVEASKALPLLTSISRDMRLILTSQEVWNSVNTFDNREWTSDSFISSVIIVVFGLFVFFLKGFNFMLCYWSQDRILHLP